MIPPTDPVTGNLPPGVHEATWDEFLARYGYTPHRLALLAGLKLALDGLRTAGCRRVYVDGSFVMISNKRQYQITRSEAERFEQALAQAEEQGAELDPRLRRAMREALESQLEELREELAEYDALRSGQVSVIEIDSLTELPEALIRARIATNLTQKELAARLGLKEQQVQRYEATRYSGVDLKRIQAVAEALGVRIDGRITLHTHMVQSPWLARCLEEARREELRREWEAKG